MNAGHISPLRVFISKINYLDFFVFFFLGRRAPCVPRKIFPRFERLSPLPMLYTSLYLPGELDGDLFFALFCFHLDLEFNTVVANTQGKR